MTEDERDGAAGSTGHAERRRGIRRTAIVLALIALGFYVAFILVTGASN